MHAEKALLRKKMLALRAAETPEARRLRDRAITEAVCGLDVYQSAHTIFCYCATEEEIATDAIISDALARGKRVCVPRCERPGEMTAREIQSLHELIPGKFGIREPQADRPVIAPEEIDFCIVPCLCADLQGFRLGYGGGYYDRFLCQTSAFTAVLCDFSRLLHTPLPREATDIPCDYIITERQVHSEK